MRRALPVLLLLAVMAAGAVAGVVRQDRADAELAAPVPPVATSAARPGATPVPVPAPRGPRATFGHACGMCHTLRAAGASGRIGPDLDAVRPSAARVRRAIRTGSLDGVMRPGLLRGRRARAMAAYVSRVAGSR
jgi:cytochrome c5